MAYHDCQLGSQRGDCHSREGQIDMKNMERAFERMKSRTQASVTDGTYAEAIKSVSESPGVAANRNLDGYRAGIEAALASGRVEAGNTSYQLSEWQEQTASKGGPALSAAMGKISPRKKAKAIAAMRESSELGAQIKSSMPGATLDQRIARSAEYARRRAAMKSGLR